MATKKVSTASSSIWFTNYFERYLSLISVACVFCGVVCNIATQSEQKITSTRQQLDLNGVATDLKYSFVHSGDSDFPSGSLFEGSATEYENDEEISGEDNSSIVDSFVKKLNNKNTMREALQVTKDHKNDSSFFELMNMFNKNNQNLNVSYGDNFISKEMKNESIANDMKNNSIASYIKNNSLISSAKLTSDVVKANNFHVTFDEYSGKYDEESNGYKRNKTPSKHVLDKHVVKKKKDALNTRVKHKNDFKINNIIETILKTTKNIGDKLSVAENQFAGDKISLTRSQTHGTKSFPIAETNHVRDGGFLPPITKKKAEDTIPVFEENYHASGVLILPHSNIAEPFEIWYAPSKKKSRIDYYYGTDKTFQRGDLGDHGIAYKYVPMYTDGRGSFDGCWLLTGTTNQPIIPQIITPNMTWFTYNSTTVYTGTLTTKWTYEYFAFGMRNHQTVWVTKSKPHRPIRYEMVGYDMMLGSYYDHYVISYITFEKWDGKEDIFNLPNDLSCYNWSRSLESSLLSNPMQEFAIFTPEKAIDIQERYSVYKSEQNKANASILEERKRTHIFKHNARFVDSHNRKNTQFKLRPNHFIDMSAEELNMYHGNLAKDTKKHKGIINMADIPDSKSNIYNKGDIDKKPFVQVNEDEIPEEIDWREFGAVTSVKGQGICSGCYAFTAAGAAEGGWFRKTGKLIEVSSQQLVDCSWGYGNHGCKGGHYASALSWIFTHGVSTDKSYGKYLGQEGYCHFNDTLFGAQIDGFSYIQPYNISALKRVVAKYGPVAVSINTKPLSFKFYSKGIYDDKECLSNQTHHSALIVGYGKLNGREYWIVKNSWSSSWGEGGYMKLAMENHLCGVTENPVAVIIKNPQFQIPMKSKLTKEDFTKIIEDRKKISENKEVPQNKKEVDQEMKLSNKSSTLLQDNSKINKSISFSYDEIQKNNNNKIQEINKNEKVLDNKIYKTNQSAFEPTQWVEPLVPPIPHQPLVPLIPHQPSVSPIPSGYFQVKIPFLESNTNLTQETEKNMIDQVFNSMSNFNDVSGKNNHKKRNHAHKLEEHHLNNTSLSDKTSSNTSLYENEKLRKKYVKKLEEQRDLNENSNPTLTKPEKFSSNDKTPGFSASSVFNSNPANPVNKSDPNYVNFYPFLGLHIEDFDKYKNNDEDADDSSSKIKTLFLHTKKLKEGNKLSNKIFLSNDLKQMQKATEKDSKEITNSKETEEDLNNISKTSDEGSKELIKTTASGIKETAITKEASNIVEKKPQESNNDGNDNINFEQKDDTKIYINALENKEAKQDQSNTDTELQNDGEHLKDFPRVHKVLNNEIAKEQILKNKERIHSLLHQNLKENFGFIPELTGSKKLQNPNNMEQTDLRVEENQENNVAKVKDVVPTKLTENLFDDKQTTLSSNDLKDTPVLNPEEKVSLDEKVSAPAINDSDETIKVSLNPEQIGSLNPEKIGDFQNQPSDNDSKPTVTGTKKSVIFGEKKDKTQSSTKFDNKDSKKPLRHKYSKQYSKSKGKKQTKKKLNRHPLLSDHHKNKHKSIFITPNFNQSKSLIKTSKAKKKKSHKITSKNNESNKNNKLHSKRKLSKLEKVVKESMDNLYSRIDRAVSLKRQKEQKKTN
ncbi:uncharacterized protein LOC100201231 isoform X3 [Hydra vulgaris]|uniref:Uncharacterized protein LOC100201231 isoform X3 n=1 Tax=Hydra vulgaris TaxID=6087 RepID=A0ABM4CT79_HYDVU